MVTFIIVLLIVGLIVGAIARLLMPGRDSIGIVGTIVLGIIGSFVGGALVRYELLQLPTAVTNVTNVVPYGYGTQILISTIGAAIVIIIARFLGGR